MVVSSSYTVGPPQTDGRVSVTEQHVLEDGQVYKYSYLCDLFVTNPEMVMSARGDFIDNQLTKRANALALVVGTSVPLTKHQFLNRFTSEERQAIRRRAKVDEIVLDFMEMLNASGGVYHTLALPGINYLRFLGDITTTRAALIGEPW